MKRLQCVILLIALLFLAACSGKVHQPVSNEKMQDETEVSQSTSGNRDEENRQKEERENPVQDDIAVLSIEENQGEYENVVYQNPRLHISCGTEAQQVIEAFYEKLQKKYQAYIMEEVALDERTAEDKASVTVTYQILRCDEKTVSILRSCQTVLMNETTTSMAGENFRLTDGALLTMDVLYEADPESLFEAAIKQVEQTEDMQEQLHSDWRDQLRKAYDPTAFVLTENGQVRLLFAEGTLCNSCVGIDLPDDLYGLKLP